MELEEEKEREEAVRRCCRSVYHNVGPIGINWLVSEISSKCTHDKESVRKEACWSFQVVLEESKCNRELDLFWLVLLQLDEESNHQILITTPLEVVYEGFYK